MNPNSSLVGFITVFKLKACSKRADALILFVCDAGALLKQVNRFFCFFYAEFVCEFIAIF